MRVLFLDIDGVLNRNGTRERCYGFTGVDRALSAKLLTWVRKNDVKIVLSSTWRLHDNMFQHLIEAGIEWIDVTPDLSEMTLSGNVIVGKIRGDEIQHYLDNHPEIVTYAIIDDWDDMLPSQQPFFVRTIDTFGVRDGDIEKLDKIFNSTLS